MQFSISDSQFESNQTWLGCEIPNHKIGIIWGANFYCCARKNKKKSSFPGHRRLPPCWSTSPDPASRRCGREIGLVLHRRYAEHESRRQPCRAAAASTADSDLRRGGVCGLRRCRCRGRGHPCRGRESRRRSVPRSRCPTCHCHHKWIVERLSPAAGRRACATTPCRMDLPGPTTSVGTRTDYSVDPWDYPAFATRHLMAWSTRTTEEKYSVRKLYMSRTVWSTPRCTRLVLSPYSDL
jgi:hypothetical protein